MVRRQISARRIGAWTAAALLAIAVIMFYLWHLNENIRLGWENAKLETTRRSDIEEVERLQARKAALLAPERVERIAKTELKLGEPREEQVAYEER
jgi:cell division protein FtsL